MALDPRSLLVFALFALSACSGVAEPADEPAQRATRPPTEAERTAARALSPRLSSALEMTTEPYQRALLCRTAIENISTRLSDSGVLNAEQMRLIKTIHDNYARQARELGAESGKTDADVDADLANLREEGQSSARTGSIVAACLQQGVTESA